MGRLNRRALRCTGSDRGVLVQLGACQAGLLPLGLLDKAMAALPPQLH